MAHGNLTAEKAAALSRELQPLYLFDARHSGAGGADAGLDRGRADDAVFGAARLIYNTREALEAAWKYVVLSLMGAGVALFGFMVLFAALHAGGGGTYTWAGLVTAAPRMPAILLQTAFLLILIGLGTKVGLVPMHTWLPDAHSQAPSPVCALLSGIETTSILYVILRLFPVMQAAPERARRNLGDRSWPDFCRHRRVPAACR